ncbi:MAG: hypothetical protein Kow0062_04530 [Acidobacteriota bacterium]
MTRGRREDDRERARLIERVVSAWRDRAPGGRIVPPAEFLDLPAGERELAYREQLVARALEAAWDPRGLSTTGRLVVAVARRLGQLAPRTGHEGGD